MIDLGKALIQLRQQLVSREVGDSFRVGKKGRQDRATELDVALVWLPAR
jgi:hypothetical protein